MNGAPMAQKFRKAIALVVLTERPELWETTEDIAVSLASRQEDIELIKTHTYGIPVTGSENEPVKIEFGEGEGGFIPCPKPEEG